MSNNETPIELRGVSGALENGKGFWRTCTGCYESEDGHPVGDYPYSHIFGCDLGAGCSECGGIGAVWDDTDYDAMASAGDADEIAREQLEGAVQIAEVCEDGDGTKHIAEVIEDLDDIPAGTKLYMLSAKAPTNADEQDRGGPDFEDGPVEDGFHQCTPYNGGHNWTSPYRERMDWIQHCTKCGAKSAE